jgi:hypothetical protein
MARAISYSNTRGVQDFIMQLHTGETQVAVTQNWSWEKRQQLGQEYLRELAEDILNEWSSETDSYSREKIESKITNLKKNLELDGYKYSDGRLLTPESDVLDIKEESGVLESLFSSLSLANKPVTVNHLNLSEEHYLASRWSDSISNSRNFLESVLREVAAAHSTRIKNMPLPQNTYEKPVLVRDYLEREGLLETKEKEALAKFYGLLSSTGSHPYMAQSDQARLLRHLALTFSQFVLLRFQGSLPR